MISKNVGAIRNFLKRNSNTGMETVAKIAEKRKFLYSYIFLLRYTFVLFVLNYKFESFEYNISVE